MVCLNLKNTCNPRNDLASYTPMKTAPKIEINTPQLDEQGMHLGIFQGVEDGEKQPFCYSYHHWHFYKSLPKKSQKILKQMLDDMIALKLSQLLDYPENWKLEGDWIGSLNEHYQILVLKNLQKAMNSKTWYRGSDLFMESALFEIIDEHFSCAIDLRNDEDYDDEPNPYKEDWNNWLSVFSSYGYDEEYLEDDGFPYDTFYWDMDFDLFTPDKDAVINYYRFLERAV